MWAIFPCPRCQSLVHRDMGQCPRCGCSIEKRRDESQLPDWAFEATLWPSGQSDKCDKEELLCPECHEAVRTGMVRCWNCRSFLPPFRKE